MTTRTDRGKRKRASKGANQRARAETKTGKRGGAPTQRDGKLAQRDNKTVLQLSPNFTVYALPPEDVCLYSEDRKFFLRGALYVALASAIGAGKTAQQLHRELAPKFPADRIDEALKRLTERGYVIPAPRAISEG